MKQFVLFLLTGIILLALDSIYLSLNRQFFELQIVSIQRVSMTVNMTGVIICYLILILGLYYFIIRENRDLFEAFLLGVFVYGIYETTNYATFKKWSEKLVIMDTLWGGVLFASTTFFVRKFSKLLRVY